MTFEELTKQCDSNKLLLVTAKLQQIQPVLNAVVKHMTDGGLRCTLVSLNKSHRRLEDMFEKEGIDISRVFFIDCITPPGNTAEDTNVAYLPDPSNLTGMEIKIVKSLEKNEGENVLVIDALSSLLIYNTLEKITRFISSLPGIGARYNSKVVVVTTPDDRQLIERVTRFFDASADV